MATKQRSNKNQQAKIGDDFRITKTTRRTSCGGAWVIGTVAGHRFDALVFAEHADYEEYELGDSRISKLLIQKLSDRGRETVANFERGWDMRPITKAAQAIVNFLAAELANRIFNNDKN